MFLYFALRHSAPKGPRKILSRFLFLLRKKRKKRKPLINLRQRGKKWLFIFMGVVFDKIAGFQYCLCVGVWQWPGRIFLLMVIEVSLNLSVKGRDYIYMMETGHFISEEQTRGKRNFPRIRRRAFVRFSIIVLTKAGCFLYTFSPPLFFGFETRKPRLSIVERHAFSSFIVRNKSQDRKKAAAGSNCWRQHVMRSHSVASFSFSPFCFFPLRSKNYRNEEQEKKSPDWFLPRLYVAGRYCLSVTRGLCACRRGNWPQTLQNSKPPIILSRGPSGTLLFYLTIDFFFLLY